MRLFVSKSLGFGFRVGVSVPLRLRHGWRSAPEPPVEHVFIAWIIVALLVIVGAGAVGE